ncbi:MAG: zinc-binding dehydrogenase [Nitrospiraceae bacterium]|nr:zinc-binding dehydrogenase [Nitrospiraceae bacterium]
MSKLSEYKDARAPLPETYTAWHVFGAGFDNLGKDGKPQTLPMRPPEANELLLRVDVLGLCLSDIKIITQGGDHPRLRGRDLANDPTVLGHECSVTVVAVGDQWKEKFNVGERYLVQADIYVDGLSFAFGYLIPGGMEQYAFVDERVLDGDEGCYLLPIQPDTGYSAAALAEPWACVEMSYCLEDRVAPGDGDRLVVTDDAASLPADVTASATVLPRSLDGLGDATFDDIIVQSPTPSMVDTLAPCMRRNGAMFLLGAPTEDGPVSLDIGRIHYDNIRFYGGSDTLETVTEINARNDLLAGGAALFIGAGGPMGQMHVQRALEIDGGPKRVVVTDLDPSRLEHIRDRFSALAESNGRELFTFAPSEFDSQEAMDERLMSLTPNGYDDVVVLAPVARVVEASIGYVADNGFVNVFAGLGIGTAGQFKLGDLCRGVKMIGSSGSRISDLRKILEMVEAGKLNTNLSVAAIGGLNAARAGLEGVKGARFPGKTVIYTQIPDLPLMALEDVPKNIPELKDKLSPQGAWTKEAEEALMEMHL